MEDQALLRQEIKKIGGKVEDIYTALMGSRITDDGGLVGQVKEAKRTIGDLNERIEKLEDKSLLLKGYMKAVWTLGGALIMLIIDLLTKK